MNYFFIPLPSVSSTTQNPAAGTRSNNKSSLPKPTDTNSLRTRWVSPTNLTFPITTTSSLFASPCHGTFPTTSRPWNWSEIDGLGKINLGAGWTRDRSTGSAANKTTICFVRFVAQNVKSSHAENWRKSTLTRQRRDLVNLERLSFWIRESLELPEVCGVFDKKTTSFSAKFFVFFLLKK